LPFSGDIGAIVADGSGGVFVLSEGGASSIVTRISASSATLWQSIIPIGSFAFHRLVADGTGGVYMVATGGAIRLYRLQSDGTTPIGWPVNGLLLSSNPQNLTDAKGDGLGGVLVCYTTATSPVRSILHRITLQGDTAPGWLAAGNPVGPVGQTQTGPGVAADGDGGAFWLWQGRTGSGPVSFYATRICADGSFAPGWPSTGSELCPNVRFTSSGVFPTPVLADGAGGAYGSWYRRTAAISWGGTMQVQRIGSEPPTIAVVNVAVGAPSVAVVGTATVTFNSVTTAGDLYFGITTGPPVPADQQSVPAMSPAVYELGNTATFSGTVEV
jgi:hypothetical protein